MPRKQAAGSNTAAYSLAISGIRSLTLEFMREHADILILDEPTAAMDAKAEAEVFQHFKAVAQHRS